MSAVYTGPLKDADQPIGFPSVHDLLACNAGELTITTTGTQVYTGPTWLGWIWVKSIDSTGEIRVYDSVGTATDLKFIFDDSIALKFFKMGASFNNGIWVDAVTLTGVLSFGLKEPLIYDGTIY